MKLCIEGWREINHSFAIVNQFQLLELARVPDLNLCHIDRPYFFSHWNKASNGVGFHPEDEAALNAIPACAPDFVPDWAYRICSPLDLRPHAAGARLAVFMVTELGLDKESFAEGSDIGAFEAAGHIVVTPSRWSRDRIIDFGFSPATVHVVPHAASPAYFFRLPEEVVQAQRAGLGFRPDETILLNIGAAIWNKGIDLLLVAFARARQKRKDLRLIFKDQRNTYGVAGDTFIQTTLAAAGLLSDDVLQAITLIPANLTMDQMNSMYAIADCYVSPYRAEGYNLPVREALACGTPVIVTEGGATDDFAHAPAARKVSSKLHEHAVIQGRQISAYCDPDLEHLIQLLDDTRPKKESAPAGLPHAETGWSGPVRELLALMG